MPNYSQEAAHEFWYRFKDQNVYGVIVRMESIEDWTVDGDEDLEQALETLGSNMDNVDNIDLEQHEKFIQLTAYLKLSRALRILQALDTAYPGAAAKLIAAAEQLSPTNPHAKLFLSRNVIFERLRLLTRVLAPERVILVQSAIEEFKHG